MKTRLPDNFLEFTREQGEIYRAFEELGRRVHESGPLSDRERRLVKLGIAIGAHTEGGVHSATRTALAGGCSADDVGHVARLAITTVGWPRAMAAMSWVRDLADLAPARKPLGSKRARRGKRRA